MNVVWPVTALYFSVFGLWAYLRLGRSLATEAMPSTAAHAQQQSQQERPQSPNLRQSALAASHCGAGCALADIAAEFGVFGLGVTVFGKELYASYLWDFVLAWSVGIIFQYFTIKPMRSLSVGAGLWAAIKADTLSIAAFQVGMYAWMALVYFRLFPQPQLRPNEPSYWLMMQIAMICGFATSLPVNRWLIHIGWKEAMG